MVLYKVLKEKVGHIVCHHLISNKKLHFALFLKFLQIFSCSHPWYFSEIHGGKNNFIGILNFPPKKWRNIILIEIISHWTTEWHSSVVNFLFLFLKNFWLVEIIVSSFTKRFQVMWCVAQNKMFFQNDQNLVILEMKKMKK